MNKSMSVVTSNLPRDFLSHEDPTESEFKVYEGRRKGEKASRRCNVYYVDVAMPSDYEGESKVGKRSKPHVAYDGKRVLKIKSLTELKDAKRVYFDALFPEIYEEVNELLKRGVKVYILKEAEIIKQTREKNGLSKPMRMTP